MRWIIFLLIVFAALSFQAAANQTIDKSTIDMIAPSMTTVSWSVFNNTINETMTYNQPISCQLDANSTGLCEITRTLQHGEKFVRNNNKCQIEVTAPECQEASLENVTHKIRYGVRSGVDDLNITFEYNDILENRSYDVRENFGFEDEFSVDCPQLIIPNNYKSREQQIRDLNLTEDEFLTWVVDPFVSGFSTYTDSIRGTTEALTGIIISKDENNAALTESNKQLSKELEQLRTKNTNCEDLEAEHDQLQRINARQVEEIDNLTIDAGKSEFWRSVSVIHFIADGMIMFFVVIFLIIKHYNREEDD